MLAGADLGHDPLHAVRTVADRGALAIGNVGPITVRMRHEGAKSAKEDTKGERLYSRYRRLAGPAKRVDATAPNQLQVFPSCPPSCTSRLRVAFVLIFIDACTSEAALHFRVPVSLPTDHGQRHGTICKSFLRVRLRALRAFVSHSIRYSLDARSSNGHLVVQRLSETIQCERGGLDPRGGGHRFQF